MLGVMSEDLSMQRLGVGSLSALGVFGLSGFRAFGILGSRVQGLGLLVGGFWPLGLRVLACKERLFSRLQSTSRNPGPT